MLQKSKKLLKLTYVENIWESQTAQAFPKLQIFPLCSILLVFSGGFSFILYFCAAFTWTEFRGDQTNID